MTVTVTGETTRTFTLQNSDRMTHRQEYLLDLTGLFKVTSVAAEAGGTLTLSVEQ
ncbi:hypothetical protein [Deinococcus sedimenti]|uniref:Uncharacterized protein n=1 Tax=Deinococcus sedimenti TaxID=1867090 RepID=A0ABQ2S370_9DEIO|nr:hypothetical protein [Deinococcus sedimenti]GGR92203.1 hypothetical protein GCM10008960_18790 [Deinococcus sedimenti]